MALDNRHLTKDNGHFLQWTIDNRQVMNIKLWTMKTLETGEWKLDNGQSTLDKRHWTWDNGHF